MTYQVTYFTLNRVQIPSDDDVPLVMRECCGCRASLDVIKTTSLVVCSECHEKFNTGLWGLKSLVLR